MRRLSKLSSASLRVARVFLGLILVASTWWTTVPSAGAESEATCHLACCAGTIAHKAGSCMNGSCHAFGGASSRQSHVHRNSKSEQLCGLKGITNAPSWTAIPKSLVAGAGEIKSRSDLDSGQRQLTTSAVTKPCQPECGNSIGFTKSQRNHSSCAAAANSQSEASAPGYDTHSQQKNALNPARRKGAPRGPPHALS